MITNLHEFFNHDFSDIENQLVDLIKHGWVLVCVLTGGRENVLPLPTDDPRQEYYYGYVSYQFDRDNLKILQAQEEIEQDIDGEISFEAHGGAACFVSESVLRDMIKKHRPDRMLLLEPVENNFSEVYDQVKREEADRYILHWADQYPEYRVAPNYNYVLTEERLQFLRTEGLREEAVDCIYQMVPGVFWWSENVLMKYCGKLREKFGTEYGQTLNDLYFNDTEQFKALFSADAIKLALGLR